MTCTREELREAAADQGWTAIQNGYRYVDIYRCEPYSIMVHFTRDGMIVDAHLLADAPEARQQLPPRVLAEIGKFDANKRRRIRSWMYDHKRKSA